MTDYWPADRSVLGKKTVTAVLKMLAALALLPRAAFSTGLISQFFAKRTDPERMLLKRGMGNGEWGMGNGEWGMGNGEWGMGNGEWGMGNGEWGMGNGEWGMGN